MPGRVVLRVGLERAILALEFFLGELSVDKKKSVERRPVASTVIWVSDTWTPLPERSGSQAVLPWVVRP